MLPFLRKHTGLIMFVLAFVFVGLAFFGDTSALSTPGSGQKMLTMKGTSYSEKEYYVLGDGGLRIGFQIPELYEFTLFLSEQEGLSDKYFANRLLLRDAAQKYGLVPSREQIESKIKSFSLFQENAAFNPESYRVFSRNLGRNGMTEADFHDLVKDALSFDRVRSLLTSGISLDDSFLNSLFNSLYATQNLKTATLNLAQFTDDTTEISDDDLKKFWEPYKNRYMSDETRSATIYTFTPVEKIEIKENDQTIPQISQKIGEVAEGIWEEVVNKRKGADLDIVTQEIARTQTGLMTYAKEELKDVSRRNLPEILKKGFNPAAGQTGTLADALFSIPPNGVASDNISNVLIMEDGTVTLFQLEKIVPSEPLDFELAREDALKDYRRETAEQRLDLAAEKLRADLMEGLKENKTFQDIAENENATVGQLEKLTLGPENSLLFFAARLTNTGEVTKVVTEPEARVIGQVIERFVEDTPQLTSERFMRKIDQNNAASFAILHDWFRNEFRRRDVRYTDSILRASGRNKQDEHP